MTNTDTTRESIWDLPHNERWLRRQSDSKLARFQVKLDNRDYPENSRLRKLIEAEIERRKEKV